MVLIFERQTAAQILASQLSNQGGLIPSTDEGLSSAPNAAIAKSLSLRERANLRAAYYHHEKAQSELSPIREAQHKIDIFFHLHSIKAWALVKSLCFECDGDDDVAFYKRLGELGLFSDQLEVCQSLLGLFDDEVDRLCLFQVGMANTYLCRYETAIQTFQTLVAQMAPSHEIDWQIRALGGVAYCYDQWSKHNRAIEYCHRQLQLLKGKLWLESETEWLDAQANIYGILGRSYMMSRSPRKAIKYLNRALAISQQTENTRLQWYVVGRLAFSYASINRHGMAQKYLEQQKLIPQPLLRDVGIRYLVLAMAQCFQGSFENALELFEESISKSHQAQDYNVECFSVLGTVLLHTLKNRYSLAIDQASRALKLSQDLDFFHHQCSANFQLSSIYAELGEVKKSFYHAHQAIAVAEKVDLPGYKASALSALAGAYLVNEDYWQCLKALVITFRHMEFPYVKDKILVWLIFRKIRQHFKKKLSFQ